MHGKVPALVTSVHRSAATKETQHASRSLEANPPGPGKLNRSAVWGKENFGASPALKTIGGALIPLGVATIGFGGIGIFIIVVGITLWVSSTMYSAHDSVRPKGQSFSAHFAEALGWAALGIPLVIGSCLKSWCCGNSSGVAKPPASNLLNKFARCCKKIVASPIMKNIAGVLTGVGAGAALGSPWMTTLLIGIGVGTSWTGGVGIAIAAVGIVLWMISTHWSMHEKPQEQDAAAHIAESAGMAVIGLPCAILDGIANGYRWCRGKGSSEAQTFTQELGLRDRRSLSNSAERQGETSSARGIAPGASEEVADIDNLLLVERYRQDNRAYVSDPSLDD